MVKNFVFNMGYDTSHVTSVLAKEGVEEGSRIILLTPEEMDERQENSINDIQNHVLSLDFDVSLEKFSVPKEFQERFFRVKELLDSLENTVLSLSGGSRDFLIPLTVVSVLTQEEDLKKVFFRSDLNSELKQIELPTVPRKLTGSEKELVKEIENNPCSAEKLVDKTGKSKSTVYRILKQLEENKLVEPNKTEGKKIYSLTFSGKLSAT